MLLEPDYGHDGVERVQLSDLRLLAVLVGLGVLRGQPCGPDVLVESLAIRARSADDSAEVPERITNEDSYRLRELDGVLPWPSGKKRR